MSREAIIAELQSRGVEVPPQLTPQGGISAPLDVREQERQAIIQELQKRGQLPREVTPKTEIPTPPVLSGEDIPVEQPRGFTERVGEDLQKRGKQYFDNIFDLIMREQTPPEAVLNLFSTGIGAVGDVMGQGVVSLLGLAPEPVKDLASEGVVSFLNTDAGKKGIEALQGGIERWERFKESNPRAARNIESAFNVGSVYIPIGGVKPIKGAAKETIEITGDVIGQGKGALQKALTKTPVVTSDDIANLSSIAYKEAVNKGGVFNPKLRVKLIDEAKNLLPKGERITSDKLVLDDVIKNLELNKSKPITLESAQSIDEQLGGLIDKEFGLQGLSKQGKDIQKLQQFFRETVEKAPSDLVEGGKEGINSLKRGRKLWSASRKLRDVERILERAELSDNPVTVIKTGFKNIVTNPRKARGFTKNEIKFMKQAAKDGIVSDALRVTLGSRLLPIIATGVGGLGEGAIAAGGSIAARGLRENISARKAARVAEEIARRAVE